jgi:YidC/Oxa1 family membrane protein insertase
MWDGILDLLGNILAFFYAIIPNAGFAIVMLTVVVRLVLFPLTAKQAKSMIAMQRVQPEIKKLQAKYKNDKQKLNEELMKFYKENKINPLGGCLPLVAQLPMFFALTAILRDLKNHVPKTSAMFHDICPGGLKACSSPKLDFFGMNLSKSATQVHGIADAWPYWVLVILVIATSYLQQRQTMRYQTQANAQMQVIGKVMPVVFGFFSINFPAGLVVYFFTSNLWQMGQQELVYRTIGTPTGEPHGKRAKAAAASKADVVEATSRDVEPGEKPAEPGGLRGLFKSIQAGAEGAGTNGGGQPSGKGGGGARAAGGKNAPAKKSTGGKPASGGTGASKGGQAARPPGSGGSQARRRNNRKRKR